jgi:lysophospholipase L1-like esterase
MTAGEVTAATGFAEDETNFRLAIDPNSAYPTKLAAALRALYTAQAGSINVANAGRSGEFASDGAKRIAQVLSVIDPEVLILLEGSNDLSGLGDRGVDSAASGIDQMAREGRSRGVSLIIATLPPPRPQGSRALPDARVRSLNNRIRAIAAGEGAVLVDLYAGLSVDVSRYIGSDGLHPTVAGYERIAELMLQAIRSSFEIRNP